MPKDPILDKLDAKFSPIVIKEKKASVVRAWLKKQDTQEIGLYLNAFKNVLQEEYPAREILLRQELTRRKNPPPDRVKQIFDWLRSQWLIAIVIVIAMVIAAVATFRDDACGLAPTLPIICPDEPTPFGERPLDSLL